MATIKELEKQVKDLTEQLEAEKAKTAEQINAEALADKDKEIDSLKSLAEKSTKEILSLKEQIKNNETAKLNASIKETTALTSAAPDRAQLAAIILSGYASAGGNREALANPDKAKYLVAGCLQLADYLIAMDNTGE